MLSHHCPRCRSANVDNYFAGGKYSEKKPDKACHECGFRYNHKKYIDDQLVALDKVWKAKQKKEQDKEWTGN